LTNSLVTAACRAKPTPAAEPNSSALIAPRHRQPAPARTNTTARAHNPAVHQTGAEGWDVPDFGKPSDKNNTMPASTATAPSHTPTIDLLISDPDPQRQGDHQAQRGQ
jgi:hypothetical protein